MSDVCVLLADGFEEIEALTAVDVLRRANCRVDILALHEKVVKGSHDIVVVADGLLADHEERIWDLVVLPGGQPGSNRLRDDGRVAAFLTRHMAREKLIGAICAAPIVLGRHGFLKGRRATCFPGFEEQLEGAILSEAPLVEDDTIITSRGPGTALLFALHLVARLKGPEAAARLRQAMQVSY